MSDYKTIERELLGIGQAEMQNIVFQILDKQYTPTNIVNLGSASGVQTTRYGTPDVFLQLSNGNYIYAEVTIQKNQLLDKIKKDIEKCKENAKILLDKNANVEKVIFACVGKIETYELQECQNLCRDFCIDSKVPFEFWGLDKISALLLHTYQSIAVSELNIKFSHGLIKTLDECLQNNEYDVSQQHEFLFREDELKEIEDKLFSKNVVLLHGPAGCGKTRLCIHLAQKIKTDKRIKEVFYIKNAYGNPFETICDTVGKDNIAVILDDINRLPFIKEFISYAQMHKNIYVLATVRDYAIDTIAIDLKNNNLDNFLDFIKISPLSKEQQEKVLKKIIPGASYDTLFSIQNVAHENLRFAIMMAEVLKKHGHLPTKMKELMEYHFNRVNADLENSITKDNNTIYLKSLVVLAFFHRIVMEDGDNNWENIKGALTKIGISCDMFHDALAYWDRQEVVNISYEGKVCEIGDQILSSYLFYKLVVEDKQIPLNDIFELFFPTYRKCFVDMFNSILPAYGYEDDLIMQPLEKLWNEHYKVVNNNETIQFILVFYGLLPLEALEYIKGAGIPLKETFLNILCGYEPSCYYNLAIDILFNHIDGCVLEEQTIKDLVEAFSVRRHSFDNNFISQIYFLNKLQERLINNEACRKLFMGLARKFLDFSFSSSEFHANTMVHFTFEAVPCECLFETRTIVWKGLITLYENEYYKDLSSLLENFRYLPNSKKIGKLQEFFDNDKKILLPFINKQLENNLSFMQKTILYKLMECCCSDKDNEYQQILEQLTKNSVEFKIYAEGFSRKRERYDWRSNKTKYDKILNEIETPKDFHSYIHALQSIEVDINTISYAVEAYFRYLIKSTPTNFENHLKTFINEFKDLDVNYREALYFLSQKNKTIEFIDFIQLSSITHKNVMLLELLRNLKCKDITSSLYDMCLQTFKNEYCTFDRISNRVFNVIEFIEFEKFQPGFIYTVFKFIQQSNNNNLNKYRTIDDFYIEMPSNGWTYHELSMQTIEEFFGSELEPVFYEMFFILIKKNILHTSEKFINYLAMKNVEYLYRYYDLYFLHEEEFSMSSYLDVDALRKLPNVAQNLLVVYERSKKLSKYFLPVFTVEKIISQNLTDETFAEFSQIFIDKYVDKEKDLSYMSTYVCSLKKEWQIIYAQTLISKNVNFEIFKNLNIFGHPSSWSGSDVTMYEKIIETIDSFLTQTNITTENISYITWIRERRSKIVEYKKKARLRELSDYRFYS